LGALASVVGESAFSAVGQAGGPAAVPSGTKAPKPLERVLETPDSQTERRVTPSRLQDLLGGVPEKFNPPTIVKTYHVGDILKPCTRPRRNSSPLVADHEAKSSQSMIDMSPLIELIVSMTARGTPRVFDGQEKEVTTPYGAITPFHLSVSVIVRQTKGGHEEVAELLRYLRRLLYPSGEEGEEERLSAADRPPEVTRTRRVLDATRATGPPGPGSRDRIQQLLSELSTEIAKLPRDRD
jgi:hypothetical protein